MNQLLKKKTLISIVTPVLNEEGNLQPLYERIKKVFENTDYEFELILVESGSIDRSVQVAEELHSRDKRVKFLSLSRNFGHQVALSAGLNHAEGAAVILMDSDLQHPPEILPELLSKWREGYENVYTIRKFAHAISPLRKFSSHLFYRIFRALTQLDLPQNSADFRLLDRRIVLHLRNLSERNRFLRGLICWTGFKSTGVEYLQDKRHSGKTKYHLKKLLFFSIDAITSFTTTPLYLGVIAGFIMAGLGFLYFLFVLYISIFTELRVPGWGSIISLLALLSGFLLIVLGLIGIYIGKIYEEVKQRPLYLVDRSEGFNGHS